MYPCGGEKLENQENKEIFKWDVQVSFILRITIRKPAVKGRLPGINTNPLIMKHLINFQSARYTGQIFNDYSLTTFPSTKRIILSAMAPRSGSWVTIIIVW